MKKLLVKILMPLVILVGVGFSVSVHAKSETIEKSFNVSANGILIVDSDQGSVEIESWNKNTVEISVEKSARNQERLDAFKVDINQSGETITILGEGEWRSRVDVEFTVKVPKKFNLDIKTGGGSIQVADMQANVKVDTSGGSISIGNVEGGNVNADTSGGSIKVGDVSGDLKVDTSGGSIRLGKVGGKSKIDTSGGSIKLEQGGDDVYADTSGGSIAIGPTKGKVHAETSGGSIRIAETQGDVFADTSGGSIKVEGSGGNVKVDSSGGSLYVGSSGGYVKADTAGGSIKIYQARGYIEADTSGGSIEAEMILEDNSADTHVTLDSAGGSITLYLPKTIEATVSADLRITNNARRDYRIYSDFPLTIKGEESDRVKANGKINGGGDKVELSTTNGDIYIKMLDK